MSKYHRILHAVTSVPWAIQREKLEAILAFLDFKAAGGQSPESVRAAFKEQQVEAAARAASISSGAVCVIPIYGSICHRSSMFSEYSGGTSCTSILAQFRQALSDDGVKAIVFDVDSPGGTIDGVPELVDEIFKARGKKPTTAIANTLMASAAYWIGAAADEVVMSPSALAGSIGVYCAHEDDSELLEKAGVKVTLISYGENKTEGNPYEPLSDSARQHMQDMVNMFGDMFTKSVARSRKVSVSKVQSDFGQGMLFGAAEAVSRGLADRVATFDQVLAKYGVSRSNSNGARAEKPGAPAEPVADGEEGTNQLSEIVIPIVSKKADGVDPDEDNDQNTPPAPDPDGDGEMNCQCKCNACMADDCKNCDVDPCNAKGCDHGDMKAKVEAERVRVSSAFGAHG